MAGAQRRPPGRLKKNFALMTHGTHETCDLALRLTQAIICVCLIIKVGLEF
jgi:hypothetical protein